MVVATCTAMVLIKNWASRSRLTLSDGSWRAIPGIENTARRKGGSCREVNRDSSSTRHFARIMQWWLSSSPSIDATMQSTPGERASDWPDSSSDQQKRTEVLLETYEPVNQEISLTPRKHGCPCSRASAPSQGGGGLRDIQWSQDHHRAYTCGPSP